MKLSSNLRCMSWYVMFSQFVSFFFLSQAITMLKKLFLIWEPTATSDANHFAFELFLFSLQVILLTFVFIQDQIICDVG